MSILTLKYRSYETIQYVGDERIINSSKMGFFCSVKAPGDIILQTFEYAKRLREQNVTVISGFHSPMEQECLRILLKGTQPIIICPARSITTMRIPKDWQTHIEQGRMLIISPFTNGQKRTTAHSAQKRNQFVADIADEVFVAYAAPDSKTEALCRELLSQGKNIFTIDSNNNKSLINIGANCIHNPDADMKFELRDNNHD